MTESNIKYELWLTRLDIANNYKNRIVDCFGDAKKVYDASKSDLLASGVIDDKIADIIVSSRDDELIDKTYQEFLSYNQGLITRPMVNYPDKLRVIRNSPYGLFYIGHFPEDFRKCVSIVGARRCSEYGRWAAKEIAYTLSPKGYTIVSGMALGIDNASHEGALRAKGRTVAVLGCGVDICYPRDNINTYVDIQKEGAIISEQYPGTVPMNFNFPTRNRIISALSNQVVVIEARLRSGSLITADFALEQGKDIYALPGRINDSLSAGCNALIEQGAGIITSIEGFVNNLEEIEINTLLVEDNDNIQNLFLEKEDLLVYSILDFYPKGIEEIIEKTNLDMILVLNSIMNLCKLNLAKEVFVNQYIKIK